MKKVININFQGTVVPIEESSYELLKQYIESLRQYFFNEEGKDEIINDIESRISELFMERLKNGSTCITDEDVNAIISNMGRPQDLEEAEKGEPMTNAGKNSKQEKTGTFFSESAAGKGKRLYRDENHKILGGVCSGIAAYLGIDPVIVRVLFILIGIGGIGIFAYILLWIFVPGSNRLVNGVRKRLYRNPDGKIIGGVCSGLGSYFNVNAWIPRVLFLIPFISFFFGWGHFGPLTFPHFLSFSFSPGSFIIYVILWLVIPEANTTSEKLEMKGEKVDLNSIKNSVLQEMKGVGERVEKLGKEAGDMVKDRGPVIGQEIHMAAKRSSGVLGNIIITLLKVFVYFILGCIALSLIIALFVVAIAAIGLFPLKNFVLTEGWQSLLAWGTLLFFIAVPVIGIITFIIRRIAGIKSSNKLIGYSFISLWIIGIICFIALLTSVGRDFKSVSSVIEEKVALADPGIQMLEVMPIRNNNYYRSNNWFRLEPFATFGMDDDTAFIRNVSIKIEKSNTDSFQVSVLKLVNGRTRRYADTLARLIRFNIYQADSLLMMDKAIAINTTDKFRNQFVEVTVAVPVGHHIRVNKNFGYSNRVRFDGLWNDNDWYDRDYDEDYEFRNGVEYVMREDGLYTLGGIPSDREDDWNSYDDDGENRVAPGDDDTNYRYHNGNTTDSLKAEEERRIQKIQSAVDSLKEAREKEVIRLKDSLRREKEEIDQKIQRLNDGTAWQRLSTTKSTPYDRSFMMRI